MTVTPAVAPSTQQGLFSCESLRENSKGGIKHCSKKIEFMDTSQTYIFLCTNSETKLQNSKASKSLSVTPH